MEIAAIDRYLSVPVHAWVPVHGVRTRVDAQVWFNARPVPGTGSHTRVRTRVPVPVYLDAHILLFSVPAVPKSNFENHYL